MVQYSYITQKVWRGLSHKWPRETLTSLSLADSYIPLTTHGPYITLLRQPTNITTIIRLTIPMGIANPSPGHANRFFLLKNNKKISGCTVDLDLLSADNSHSVWHYRYCRPFVIKYQSFPVVYASALLGFPLTQKGLTTLGSQTARKASYRPLSFNSSIRLPLANSVGFSVLSLT
jgi:hypothetical protein